MDRSPEPQRPNLPSGGPEDFREDVCPGHGAFQSRRIIAKVWSRCPVCTAEDDAKRAADAQAEAERRRAEAHRQFIEAAAIPARFVGRTFDNFEADTDPKRHALTVARDFVEGFELHRRTGAALIFSGRPGTGKSHLAAAMLQALRRYDVRYATCMDMIRAVRETWRRDSEKTESQVLNFFGRLDLLVIDEVGMQYGTDGEQTILFDVLDRRYREMLPVVILTNQAKDGLRQFIGDRSYDRLRETSRWVAFDWDSYRPKARAAA